MYIYIYIYIYKYVFKFKGNGGLFAIMFTCGVCDTRQARTFSKKSYEEGVVLIRCEGCDKLHLIADNLGWFEVFLSLIKRMTPLTLNKLWSRRDKKY